MTMPTMMEDELLAAMVDESVCQPVRESWCYVDEPRHFRFQTRILAGTPIEQSIAGSAITPDQARRKAIFEAFERYCLSVPLPSEAKQVEEVRRSFHFDRMPRLDLPEQGCVWMANAQQFVDDSLVSATVPVQLITVPYTHCEGELCLREPISTGAACGDSRDDAILRGLLECVERDGVVTSFYARRGNAQVVVSSHAALGPLEKELRRCKLELLLVDVSSPNFSPYTFLALLLDETEFGPAVTAGAKSGFDPAQVALGAIEETLHARGWLRDQLSDGDGHFDQTEVRDQQTVRTFLDRARVWSPRSMIRHLDFYRALAKRDLASYEQRGATLAPILVDLERLHAQVFVIDLSSRFAWSRPLAHVVKVIVPPLQPLFIDESWRVLSPKIGDAPSLPTHFFL
jgi:ribosomal protein S12 methylthiotransferase accessory factor